MLTATDTTVIGGKATTEWSRGFTYDAYGNASISGSLNPPSLNYDLSHNQIAVAGVSYDAAGNQTTVTMNTLVYDAENRITTETDGANRGVTTHTYDGNGHRVVKSNSAGTTVFVYDAFDRMAAEYTTVAENPTCITCYLSPDHLGTTRLVTDQNAAIVARHDYLPFGEEVPSGMFGRDAHWGAGNDSIRQKFTGKERDSESGLDYFGARFYSGYSSRFVNPDWSETPEAVPYASLDDPQTLNQYAYLRNNPLGRRDSDGHCCDATDVLGLGREVFGAPDIDSKVVGGILILAGVALGANDPDVQEAAGRVRNFVLEHPIDSPEMQGYKTLSQMTDQAPDRKANDRLRRDPNGRAIPDQEAQGEAHTQLGTRDSKSQPGKRYKQAREFDNNGKPIRDVDFTDHGRPNQHTDPHEHPYHPTTGQRGKAQPCSGCNRPPKAPDNQ